MAAINNRKATKPTLCNEPQIDRNFGDSPPRSLVRIPLLRAKDGAFEVGGMIIASTLNLNLNYSLACTC